MFAMCTAILFTACGGKQERTAKSSQLREVVEQFGIDTIKATPSDTICNNSIDEVLRHYPELYHATKKAKKAYDAWTGMSTDSRLRIKPTMMDVTTILDEALFGTNESQVDDAWQHLSTIDSLYIQALVNIPNGTSDTDVRKSAIGRMRKAWQAYIQQLQKMEPAIPENCRRRYLSTIKDKTKQLIDPNLYKQKQ